MDFEVDHVFVVASPGASEADELRRLGFAEGPPNIHPGQGTACRRFFFEGAYLELLWLVDSVEATSPPVAPTGLAIRARGDGPASHVGICLRRATNSSQPIPIETWPYSPPYLPKGMALPMASNSSVLDEPLIFFLPPGMERQHIAGAHSHGARTITCVSLTLSRSGESSPALEWLADTGLVDLELGEREALRLELDQGVRGRSTTLTTFPPLELEW